MDDVYEVRWREPAFYAIIPAPVRHCEELTPTAKLLYGEINALSGRYGYCFADNSYFADLYSVSERTIARFISQLATLQFIQVSTVRDKLGHVTGRRIYIGCGFPIPEQGCENDPLTNMTKMSVRETRLTKLSGLNDKIVSQALNNNINNKNTACAGAREEKPPRKKKTDDEPRAELVRWARETFPDDNEALISALMRYCDMRREKGWMMETIHTAIRCEKRLMNFSKGDLPMIIAILEQSIDIPWQDVYALKKDDPFWLQRSAQNEGTYEKWL